MERPNWREDAQVAEMPDESLNVTDLGVWYVRYRSFAAVLSVFVLGAAQCLFLSQPLDKEGRVVCCCGGVEGYCSWWKLRYFNILWQHPDYEIIRQGQGRGHGDVPSRTFLCNVESLTTSSIKQHLESYQVMSISVTASRDDQARFQKAHGSGLSHGPSSSKFRAFPSSREGVTEPDGRGYIPIIRILWKLGMTIPNIRILDTGWTSH